MKTTLAVLAALSALIIAPAGAQTPLNSVLMRAPSNGIPIVRVDKPMFATGETVFFWTGVKGTGDGPIPKEYWGTCRQTLIRPDGTQSSGQVQWPIDGMGVHSPGDTGWLGGCGLGEHPKAGRYLVVFEFAGQKTLPMPIIVKDFPVLKRIKADFIFGPQTKLSDGSTDTPVTLVVHNDTDQTIRFPHRDGLNGLVSLSLSSPKGYRNDGFYPADKLLDQDERKLPDRSPNEFTWADVQDIPTITLKPGGKYEQHLSLHTAVMEDNRLAAQSKTPSVPSGLYKVTFSTTLQVLIGEAGGDYAAVSPVHIPVIAAANCTIAP